VRGYISWFETREETLITVRDINSRADWVNRKGSKQTESDTNNSGRGKKQEETCKLTEVDNEV